MQIAEPTAPIPPKTKEEQLAALSKQNGVPPTEDQVRLADAVDRSVAAIENVAAVANDYVQTPQLQLDKL